MDYPIWNIPFFGGSMVIAAVAIVHVFIAQYAVGAALINAVIETRSLKKDDPALKGFLRDHSLVTTLLPFILGAVSGAAILAAITLVSPETTAALLHLLFFAWMGAWLFSLIAVVAGYIYHYTWDRLSPRRHCIVGWIYALAALAALILVNSILCFMVNPGDTFDSTARPITADLWSSFFTPTYFPALIIRIVGSLALGALGAIVLITARTKYTPDDRARLTQIAARFLLPMALIAPATIWYLFQSPALSISYLTGGAIAMVILFAFTVVISLLIAAYSYGAIIIARRPVNLETALLLLTLAFIATGASEFVREGMRKPYLVWNHIYSNGIFTSDVPTIEATLAEQQLLRNKANAARRLKRPYDGPIPNDTALQFSPWSVNPNHAELLRLVTTAEDIALERGLPLTALPTSLQADPCTAVSHLHVPDETFYTLDPALFTSALRETHDGKIIRGRWLYDAQCLRCHCLDGYNAVRPLVRNFSPAMLNQMLQELELYRGFMPPFYGSVADREDLALYMHQLNGACSRCHENLTDDGHRTDDKKIKAKENWPPLP